MVDSCYVGTGYPSEEKCYKGYKKDRQSVACPSMLDHFLTVHRCGVTLVSVCPSKATLFLFQRPIQIQREGRLHSMREDAMHHEKIIMPA
jgi:hypothetical protein